MGINMKAWNPYNFTNAEAVVTVLILLMLIIVLAGLTLAPYIYRWKIVFWSLLLFWVFTILSATFFGRLENENGRMRLDLFWTISTAWSKHQGIYWYYIIGNILLFMPLGILLPLVDLRLDRCLLTTLTGAGVSLLVEAIQYVTGTGLCELDDLFHNTWGTFTGYQAFAVFHHLLEIMRIRQHDGDICIKRLWGWSLSYLLGLGLFFAILLYINKPDWTGVFY